MAKQKTTSRSSLQTWGDVDEKLRIIASNKTIVAKSEAAMNAKTLEIQKRYEEDTRDAREKMVAAEKEIELFALAHRDEFTDVKTRILNYGLVSFRLTSPKLTTLKGFTWDTALKLLKKFNMSKFIRTKEEVDKDAIKLELTEPKDLAEIGLALTQSESFYYETYQQELI